MTGTYILVDGEPREADLMTWATWFESADRIIARTEQGGVMVSTVFLGVDHNFSPEGAPVLWETMVIGGPLDGEQEYYTSVAAAQDGHEKTVERVKAEGRA